MSSFVIIVTHNSSIFLAQSLERLSMQTVRPCRIAVVDSGSSPEELKATEARCSQYGAELVCLDNVGFGAANNEGCLRSGASEFVLFLNPDTFLNPTFIETAESWMRAHPNCGIASGPLLGYDLSAQRSTGLLDSTGIFRKWYGRWFDRDRQRPDKVLESLGEERVPAICGALMFCRNAALLRLSKADGHIFDPGFFLYYEDVDLSLRIARLGFELVIVPDLWAYHCRGWRDRKNMPRFQRLAAARSAVRLERKLRSPYVCFAWLKLRAVQMLDA